MTRATILHRVGAFSATLLLLALSLPISLVNPGAVLADSRVVTSLADDGGEGTLRYAIENSNEGDSISFAAGLSGTILLDPGRGELDITHALTIEGPGDGRISIDGGHETRVLVIAVGDVVPVDIITDLLDSVGGISSIEAVAGFLQVEPSGAVDFDPAVVIEGLTLRNGALLSVPEDVSELFDAVGANLLVLGSSALLRDCVIETGFATGGGGGIAAAASLLSLESCTVRQNTVGGLDYDVGFSGGGGGLLTAVAYVGAEDCVFQANVAQEYEGGMGIGGGLVSLVSLWDFDGCVIRDNVAEDGDGPPGFGGGIVAVLSMCDFSACDILDNIAGDGDYGGIGGGVLEAYNLLFNMQQCTITGNAAGPNSTGEVEGMGGGVGGGMFIGPALCGGTIVRDSLIAGNVAGSDDAAWAAGGGVAFAEIMVGSVLTAVFPQLDTPEIDPGQSELLPLHLVNCTLSGNAVSAALGSTGGGLWATGESPIGLSFCTVADNTASWGGGLSTDSLLFTGEEPAQSPYGVLLLKNSVVADNTALAEARGGDEPSPPVFGAGNDIWGPIVSLYGNVIGDPEGWGFLEEPQPAVPLPVVAQCVDIVDVDARLGPLADNGGPTMTHELRTDSPALDAACDGLAIAEYNVDFDELIAILSNVISGSEPIASPGQGEGAPVEFDQRGESRPIDGDADGEAVCDSGAFEARPDIEVRGGSGGQAAAPTATEGNCSTTRVTISNEGTAPLLIVSAEFEGSGAGDFALEKDLSGTVLQPGESIQVTVRFCPRAQGNSEATLLVYSSDPDEPIAEVGVAGRGREARDLEPAKMSTSYLLIDPAQVLPGQQVTVSANVCNGGEEKGSLTAVLGVNGIAEQSQSVSVSAGSCKAVAFTVAKAVPGTYQVSVNGMLGQFSVLAPRTVQSTVESRQDTGLGTAGLAGIAAVALALVIALVVLFRRS